MLLFVSLRFYIDLLGPAPFGVAMLAAGAFSLLDGLGSMAFAQVLALLLKDYPDQASRNGLALGLGLRFIAWLALLAAIGLTLAWFALGPNSLAVLALPAILFCVTEPLRATAQMCALLDRRLHLSSTWAAAEAVLTLACSLLLILLSNRAPAALPAGMMLGRSIGALVFSRCILGHPANWIVSRQSARAALPRAVRFGWSVAALAPLGWLGVFADRYIVNATTGVVAAGVLAALSGLVTRPYAMATASLTNVYRPDLLDLAAGRSNSHQRPLRNWLRASLGIGIAGIAGFAVIGIPLTDFLVPFPTPDINRGGLIVLIAFAQVFVLLTHAVDNELLALGRGRSMLASQATATVLGLVIIAVGAIWAGVEGAATGRIATEALKFGVASTVLRLRGGKRSHRANGAVA